MSDNNQMKIFELTAEEIDLITNIDQLWQEKKLIQPINFVSGEGDCFVLLSHYPQAKNGWSC